MTEKEIKLNNGQRLSDVMDEIQPNTILYKTVCGIGATTLELETERNSIIIEPNVPVIKGKEQKYPSMLGVYEGVSTQDIEDYIKGGEEHKKIMTTPESFPKIKRAMINAETNMYQTYFLLYDECDRLISDVNYRSTVTLPTKDFFKFRSKAMVSATPILPSDPRFADSGFEMDRIVPTYDYRQGIEIIQTNNVKTVFRTTLKGLDDADMVCVFYNSTAGIENIITSTGIRDDSYVYCSTESMEKLKSHGFENVSDTLTVTDGYARLEKYNFFTSRFYSAVDIELEYKPVVILLTELYSAPHTMIDPETEAIQIAGRFRNGTDRIIHITNTATSLSYESREQLRERLQEEHQGYLKLDKLYKEARTAGEKEITEQAISRTDYVGQGFVDGNGNINYFRHNNAYLDERLKMLYTHPARLYRAYEKSGAFTVYSEAEFAVYTDEERRKLKDTNTGKAERIGLLFNIISKAEKSRSNVDWLYYKQLMDELRNDYALYMEAFGTIGYAKVKELNFVDSDIKTAVNDFKYRRDTTRPEIKDAAYKAFSENTVYKTSDIKVKLKGIYDNAGLNLHRKPQGQDICQYFEATEKRNGNARGWQLGKKLEK